MTYNLSLPSASDFEDLGADILSICLGRTFCTFSDGKDGGVDIRKANGSKRIHWRKSLKKVEERRQRRNVENYRNVFFSFDR